MKRLAANESLSKLAYELKMQFFYKKNDCANNIISDETAENTSGKYKSKDEKVVSNDERSGVKSLETSMDIHRRRRFILTVNKQFADLRLELKELDRI